VGVPPTSVASALGTAVELVNQLVDAERALAALNMLGLLLPNPHLLIRPFLQREAVASSRIEGTVTDLRQLMQFEADASTAADQGDAREVSNYVRAIEYGLSQPPDRALSPALIKEIHALLMDDVRGSDRNPGQFRRVQVYISDRAGLGARFVPPPPTDVPVLIDDLIIRPTTTVRQIEERQEIPAFRRSAM
jgi:Fic family protein